MELWLSTSLLWSGALWIVGVLLKLLFSVSCQATVAFKATWNLKDVMLRVVFKATKISSNSWAGISVASELLNTWKTLWFLSESTTIPFRVTKILSTVGVDIPADFSFHGYQNPVNSRSWHLSTVAFRPTYRLEDTVLPINYWGWKCSFQSYLKKEDAMLLSADVVDNHSF